MYAESREEKLSSDFERLRKLFNNIETDLFSYKKMLQEISGQDICVFDFALNSQINNLLFSLSSTLDSLEQSKYSKMVLGLISVDNPQNSKLFIDKFPKELVEHYSKICPECNIRVFKRLPVCICGHTFENNDSVLNSNYKRKHNLKYDPTLI